MKGLVADFLRKMRTEDVDDLMVEKRGFKKRTGRKPSPLNTAKQTAKNLKRFECQQKESLKLLIRCIFTDNSDIWAKPKPFSSEELKKWSSQVGATLRTRQHSDFNSNP